MLRHGLFTLLAILGTVRGAAAQSFTYEPFNLTNVATVSYFDLSTLLIQPPNATSFNAFTVTVDWAVAGGDPYSNEALFSLTNSASPTLNYVSSIFPTTGAAGNGNPATLTWTGLLNSTYTTGTPLFFGSAQDYTAGGSAGNWSAVTLTLYNTAPPPPPPHTVVDLGGSLNTTLAAVEVKFFKITVATAASYTFDTLGTTIPGEDTELGLYSATGALLASNDDIDFANDIYLSRITTTLDPGEYYLAVGAYNTVFESAFGATSTSSSSGNVVVNGIATPVPEPSLLIVAGAAVLGVRRLRRRPVTRSAE